MVGEQTPALTLRYEAPKQVGNCAIELQHAGPATDDELVGLLFPSWNAQSKSFEADKGARQPSAENPFRSTKLCVGAPLETLMPPDVFEVERRSFDVDIEIVRVGMKELRNDVKDRHVSAYGVLLNKPPRVELMATEDDGLLPPEGHLRDLELLRFGDSKALLGPELAASLEGNVVGSARTLRVLVPGGLSKPVDVIVSARNATEGAWTWEMSSKPIVATADGFRIDEEWTMKRSDGRATKKKSLSRQFRVSGGATTVTPKWSQTMSWPELKEAGTGSSPQRL